MSRVIIDYWLVNVTLLLARECYAMFHKYSSSNRWCEMGNLTYFN